MLRYPARRGLERRDEGVYRHALYDQKGYTESYIKTNEKYTITYYDDDNGEEHIVELNLSTEIKQPKIEETDANKC